MSILAFQMPDKVVMEKSTDFVGTFEFKPLEKGYGVTIGNAMRRILLSSLEGYAITTVRVQGVLHEFSTIEGVVEDMTEIILNLKQVRFKKLVDNPSNRIALTVKNEVFTAGLFNNATSSFEILNPDLVICNIAPGKELEIEITVEKGRGYVPADENKQAEQLSGVIPIDAIYTPIKNVKYSVENTRVEQKTDYERLLIEVETDGSIHPEDALKGAAVILLKHFRLFTDQLIEEEVMPQDGGAVETIDEEFLQMRKLLKTPLSELDLSVRAYNCLKAADVRTLGDLAKLEVSDMMKFRNFGKKSLIELETLIQEKGLMFGMDVSKFKLDED